MNDVNDNDIKNTDDLILKIQKAQPSFLDCKCSENQFLKKYHFILTENAKERLNKLYTYIKKKNSSNNRRRNRLFKIFKC